MKGGMGNKRESKACDYKDGKREGVGGSNKGRGKMRESEDE